MTDHEFGSYHHLNASYSLVSSDFIPLPHFIDGVPNEDVRIKLFIDFVNSIPNESCSLRDYISKGGHISDFYHYILRGCGQWTSITIPETIAEHGSLKLLKEMISIDPAYIDWLNEYSLLAHCITFNKIDMVEFLLCNGANPNNSGKRNKTPLYQAICSNNLKAVKLLLEHGADPNLTYAMPRLNYLYTALDIYCSKQRYLSNHEDGSLETAGEIIKLLIAFKGKEQLDKYDEAKQHVYEIFQAS